jgi:hypothetical protein
MPDAPPAQAKGLFGPKPVATGPDLSSVLNDINSVNTRVRLNEERFGDLRKKIQFLEQAQLSFQKKVLGEIKMVQGDITSLKRDLGETKNRLVLLIKELQLTAKKSDIDVLQKYLDMWQPVKWVQVDQVGRIVREELEKMAREGQQESRKTK